VIATALILVIEDNESIQEFLQLALTNEGYGVVSAYNGQQALEIVEAQRPNLILLDMWMPKMDGKAFVNRYRSLPHGTAPIIVMTSYDDVTLDKSFLSTVDDYLAKPFDLNRLLDCIESHLQSR
jgi:DNA-binding response OmpR family regulator